MGCDSVTKTRVTYVLGQTHQAMCDGLQHPGTRGSVTSRRGRLSWGSRSGRNFKRDEQEQEGTDPRGMSERSHVSRGCDRCPSLQVPAGTQLLTQGHLRRALASLSHPPGATPGVLTVWRILKRNPGQRPPLHRPEHQNSKRALTCSASHS